MFTNKHFSCVIAIGVAVTTQARSRQHQDRESEYHGGSRIPWRDGPFQTSLASISIESWDNDTIMSHEIDRAIASILILKASLKYSCHRKMAQLAFKILMILDICNSHYVSQLAAFFIVGRTKTSTVRSCHWLYLYLINEYLSSGPLQRTKNRCTRLKLKGHYNSLVWDVFWIGW